MASWSTKQKVLFGLGVYFAVTIALLLIFGNQGKNDSFKPQDEFKLHAWIPIHIGGIDFSINRAASSSILRRNALTGRVIFLTTCSPRSSKLKPAR